MIEEWKFNDVIYVSNDEFSSYVKTEHFPMIDVFEHSFGRYFDFVPVEIIVKDGILIFKRRENEGFNLY